MEIDLVALRLRYLEQLPTMTAMLVPDDDYDPEEVAREAVLLIESILNAISEYYEGSGSRQKKGR